MTDQVRPSAAVSFLATPGYSVATSREILNRLVVALETAFTLPDTHTLCALLGVEVGSSAHAILLDWVCRVLLDVDEVQAAQRLPDLVERLDSLLTSRRIAE